MQKLLHTLCLSTNDLVPIILFAGMKRWHVIVVLVAGILALAGLLLPAFSKARAYSGPGVQGNLLILEVAKARWLAEHRGGAEWPTKQDLLPYLTNGTRFTTFDEVIRPHDRETYSINRTGAPVTAYDPRSERLFTLGSNKLALIEQLK